MRQVAIDFETFLISEDEGSAPHPVCLSFYDGTNAGILVKSDIPAFLLSLSGDEEIIAHNIKFEFSVILKHYPELTEWVLDKLNRDLVWCTLVSEQIKNVASPVKANKFGLSELVQRYLGIDISPTKTDPEAWRTRYQELVDVPLSMWPEAAVTYSIMDSKYAYLIRQEQNLTHRDSVKGSVMLGMMSDRGFQKRSEYVASLYQELIDKMAPMQDVLIAAGFAELDKKGKFKRKTKAIREYLIENIKDAAVSDKGNILTDRKTLNSYSQDSLVSLWSSYAHLEKLASTYIKTIDDAKGVVRTDYNVVVDTCRTSARSSNLYPALNMQNIPRDDGIRECFAPRAGFRLVSIDYSALELACVAQQLYSVYKKSAMRDALNYGDSPVDLHSILGSKLMEHEEGRSVSYEEFVDNKKNPAYSKYRTLAKPLNLGYPGGIGPVTMARTAKDMYGVEMTPKQARELRTLFFKAYPELETFLKRDADSLKIGQLVDSITGESKDEYYYRFKGMLRRGCSYNAACNGFLMQTPAAFGTKRMLWRLLQNVVKRKDIFPLAFIHDEVLFEILDDEKLDSNIEEMAYLMVDSMKEILPDVRIGVESETGYVWSKAGMSNAKQFWR